MNNSTIILSVLLGILCGAMSFAAQPTTAPLAGNDIQLSAEEQMLLAQEFDNMIDEMTKGMSEEEKNKFINDIVDEVEKISNMSEEQFTNYVNKLEADMKTYGLLPDQPTEIPTVQPAPSEPTAKPVEVPHKTETKKPSRDMVPAIDGIIKHLDSLIQKSNQFVEMAADFSKWGEKGKLRGWNPTMTWPIFKEKIDTLKNTFATIKSSDPKTAKPKYLADLTAHETLCNNINQFKTVLEKHEPKIQVPSFGLKAISEDSKNAFIETINDCLEALLALNMQSELEKIIAKYEPTAKKIKEAEEKAQQAALEASKRRPATPAPMRTTVRYGEEQGYYEFGGVQEKSPSSYAPYSSPSYGQIPGYTPEKKEVQPSGSGKSQESPKDTPTKKEVPMGPASKKEDVKETETTKKIEQKYIDFSVDIDQAFEFLDGIEDSVRKHIKSSNPSEIEKLTSDIKALTNYLNTAKKSASAARTSISSLDKGSHKDKWIKNFQSYWNKYRNDFINLRDFFAQTQIPTPAAQQAKGEQADKLNIERERLQDAMREYSISTNSLNTTIQEISTPAIHRRRR
jgi:hypothetical protein